MRVTIPVEFRESSLKAFPLENVGRCGLKKILSHICRIAILYRIKLRQGPAGNLFVHPGIQTTELGAVMSSDGMVVNKPSCRLTYFFANMDFVVKLQVTRFTVNICRSFYYVRMESLFREVSQ